MISSVLDVGRHQCCVFHAVLLGAALTVPVSAFAQRAATGPQATANAQSAEETRALFRRATAAFDARDFESALRLYQQAYINSEQPELLMNIAQTFDQLNRLSDARAALRRYLDTAREIPNREDVEAQLRSIEGRIATATAAAARTTTATPATTTTATTGPVIVPSLPPPPPRPIWPWIVMGAGGALAAGGAVVLVLRPDASTCVGGPNMPCNESEFLSRRDTASVMNPLAIGMLAAGGGLIVTGIIGAAMGGGRTESSAQQRTTRRQPPVIAVAASPNYAGLQVFSAF